MEGITPLVYDNYDNALLDIHNGRLDGIFGDTPGIRQLLKPNHQLGIVDHVITDSRYFGNGPGIAVRKNNAPLLRPLQGLKQDGTLHQITERWLKAVSCALTTSALRCGPCAEIYQTVALSPAYNRSSEQCQWREFVRYSLNIISILAP